MTRDLHNRLRAVCSFFACCGLGITLGSLAGWPKGTTIGLIIVVIGQIGGVIFPYRK